MSADEQAVRETTAADFERDVVQASNALPILVDFWAPWCAPCRMLGPVLERLAQQAAGRWRLVKIDTEAHPAVAMQYRISSIPAVKLFRDSKVVAEFTGAQPESHIARWLFEHIPPPSANKVDAARAARDEGDLAKARTLLNEALALDPDLPEGRVMLAEMTFTEDPDKAVNMVQDIGMGTPYYDQVSALRELRGLWHLQPEGVDTQSAAWPHFSAGLQALRGGDYQAAAEAWIDALRRDRRWEDGAARRACVALFRWLGDAHPVTQGQRRAFSSALF